MTVIGTEFSMDKTKDSRIFWFLPSISDVIFIIVILIILTGKANLLGDADTGYHIRTGEYIIENLKVPHHDLFSHITPPLVWTVHEWLSEVIYALIHKFSGLSGIVLFTAILIASAYAVLFKFLKSSGINTLVAVFVVALATGVSTIHWLARPHIFSLFLTLIWYIVLDTYQYKKKNYLYILPPLMLLWVNLHGGFITGFLLLAIYIAGNIFKGIFVKEEGSDSFNRIKTLFLISIICLVVCLINPRGYEILLFPFKVISNKFMMNHVNEYLSPDFHAALKYEYMLLLMIVVFGISILRLNIIETMLVLLFTHMSLYSARYIPLYSIILSPIIGKRIDDILESIRGRNLVKRFLALSDRTGSTDSLTRWHIWSFLTIAVLIFMLFSGKIEYGFDKKKLPVDAVQFLKKEKIKGNMFNNDEFGDYIIYAAWPEYKVFFDGRSDMYGEERMREYFKIIGIRTGWEDVFKKYNVNLVIYQPNSALSNYLLERNDWKLIYADKVADIFVKNTPENHSLIEKYPDVKQVIVEDKPAKSD
jgi:hypothetical protein